MYDITDKMDPQNEKEKEWAKHCSDLLKAKLDGEITQEVLDYEMAKLSLEFLDAYRPQPLPQKPYNLRLHEELSKEDIAQMGKASFAEKEKAYWEEFGSWRAAVRAIRERNISNLLWLRACKKSLKKRGQDSHAEVVRGLIEEHEKELHL